MSSTESDEPPEPALPQACFDTANTTERCQILYRYAELLEFGNIPDYVGFIESFVAEARGEKPFPPLEETVEFERFTAAISDDEQPSEALRFEISQFLSYRMQLLVEFRHAQDPVSMQIQEAFFRRLMLFNTQLLPHLDELEALEFTFLQAHPRFAQALGELNPIINDQLILTESNDAPEVLGWLARLYGLDDEYTAGAMLSELAHVVNFGGNPFDLVRLDQRPGIGTQLNMPIDAPIMITEVLAEDVAQLRDAQSKISGNTLQDIHFYEPYRINNLLSLIRFAEYSTIKEPRLPYAQSRSLIDAHVYVEPELLAQILAVRGESTSVDGQLTAAIIALRSGVSLPLVGSQFVRLEDAQAGHYVVVELMPIMARLVYIHTEGYRNNQEPASTD